ncbi:MAG: FAD-dependent oxidoreductase [Spirochaetales bacterium]|uniref:FAD-dependent oxidoreductase n=1 Tax=Candidatus Thalassospirochaeta sargassi TaxID=3119039 RepID=A0AAJ1ICB9_9SPIO|nr:FAD-dependent oxidoreductase [Spirochaetales bacterium]
MNTDKLRLKYKTAVIGAGPAGLAAAGRLIHGGMTDFIIIEREHELGGILNQCIHNGFGLEFYHEDLTGPQFARRMEKELLEELSVLPETTEKPAILCSSMVTATLENGRGYEVQISSRTKGILTIEAETVITTTGCRERTRGNLEIPGTRPAGIFTAGQAQNLINRHHYAIGRKIIIQGSGDIGLIMARRLTLEGFDVIAVLERLPYLSGLIRNKVQCLDHFGIPLHLGRQITDIKGRGRLSSVLTKALDKDFNPLEGSELRFDCDTILIAAGLIPELESVKTAGVELFDRLRPEVNTGYETVRPGLFAAGNCLHINDLADSAAVEGANAADSVLKYLEAPDEFRAAIAESGSLRPYKDPLPETELNEDYFNQLKDENYLVCIVCPKGCLLREGEYGCRRGEDYYKRTVSPAGAYSQRIHTTVEICGEIVPAVSVNEVAVSSARDLIIRLKSAAASLSCYQEELAVKINKCVYVFKLCPPSIR